MFFQNLGNRIDSIFQLIEDAASSDMVHDFSILLAITFTLIIMIKGYATLAGKTQDPIRELLWDIVIKLAIVAIAFNYGGMLTKAIAAMEGIHAWAGGGVSLYAEMDNLFDKTKELAETLMAADPSTFVKLDGAIGAGLSYAGFGFAVLGALIIIIITSFTLKILIMLAPFMIFALFYGWTKNMFSQWLSLFFANTLTLLMVTVILKTIISNMEKFIDAVKGGAATGTDLIYLGVEVLIFGIVLSVIIQIAKEIAEKIATVSIESIGQSGFVDSFNNTKNAGKAGYNNAMAAGKGSVTIGKEGYRLGKAGYQKAQNLWNKFKK